MNKPKEKTKKMIIRTKLGFREEKGVITGILFTERNLVKNTLVEAHIAIKNIKCFGTRHEFILSTDDNFRRFDKIGYISSQDREYITTKFVVKELRKYLENKITEIVKETVVGQTSKTAITAHNWHYNL